MLAIAEVRECLRTVNRHEVDESVTVEYRSSDEQSFSNSYDEEENQKSSSERKSSVLEIFQTKELSITSTPRRG